MNNPIVLTVIIAVIFLLGMIWQQVRLIKAKDRLTASRSEVNVVTIGHEKVLVAINDAVEKLEKEKARYASLESALHRERTLNNQLKEGRYSQNKRINELLTTLSKSHQRVGKKMLKLGVNPDGTKVGELA